MTKLDPRLHAFRPDLADESLKDKVEADYFVKPMRRRIKVPVANLYRTPDPKSSIDTQFLMGTDVLLFEEANGYGWVQSLNDCYVGYVLAEDIETSDEKITHTVKAPRTFLYPQADLKYPALATLSMGSRLTLVDEAETRGSRYGILSTGAAVFLNHLMPVDDAKGDFVAVAEELLSTPYLWGGASALGIDCSGLVQLSFAMTGKRVLRDTDMQEKTIGAILPEGTYLERGDIVFWKGHVAIMIDDRHIIHANGASMDVRVERLDDAIERIAKLYSYPTNFCRP